MNDSDFKHAVGETVDPYSGRGPAFDRERSQAMEAGLFSESAVKLAGLSQPTTEDDSEALARISQETGVTFHD